MRGGRMEGRVCDPYWPFRVPCYAICPGQHPLRIPGLHEVLREFIHRFVLVYIDDILFYSWSMAKYRHQIAEVLKHLRKLQFFLKVEKCSFYQFLVQFLGYHINNQGIQMDEGKVSAIQNWPTPTTVKKAPAFPWLCETLPIIHQELKFHYHSNLLKGKPKSLSWIPATQRCIP